MEHLPCFQHLFIQQLLVRRVTLGTYFDSEAKRIYQWIRCGVWKTEVKDDHEHTVLFITEQKKKDVKLETGQSTDHKETCVWEICSALRGQ